MVLSDRTIRRLLSQGRIEIDPLDETLIQPSSVDVRVDRFFRVFHNARYPYIDVKQPQEDLTELVEVTDDSAFILHPGEFVLGSTLERIRLPDDLVARLEGKALALDTPIPTSTGWSTMGDLRPGDEVFDEVGEPTVIVAATEPMTGRPCREVLFSDSTTVVCDLEHEWATVDKNGRRYGCMHSRIRTTAEIEQSLRVRDEWNHHIPLARPIWCPERQLAIDPYVLGAWLGDGTSTKAEITCSEPEILHQLVGAGYAVAEQRTRPRVYRVGGTGHTRDAANGRYVRNESLSSKLDGADCGPKYEVQFTPNRPVFRLSRKLLRQKTSGWFHRFRAIVDVREVPSVPVRCVQVSSPHGLFLITRSFIPTHNSSLGRLGLLIHSTAGFIDPGWDGHVTLELSNVANLPITIYYGMKIGQLSFVQLSEPAETPYGADGLGSKYQGQKGPTPSRYWKNFDQ